MTLIKALSTFRNATKLPDGIIKNGQVKEVSDSYAEALVKKGLAEVVEDESEEEPDTTNYDGGEEFATTMIPQDFPAFGKLKGAEIHTFHDLYSELDHLTVIKGIGTATADEIQDAYVSYRKDFNNKGE